MSKEAMEEEAWQMFADAYPQEAATLDWDRFLKYVQKRAPGVTEKEIKTLLKERDGE